MTLRFSRAFRLVRDLWLFFGIALVIVAILEGGYQLQARARTALRARLNPEKLHDYPYRLATFPYVDSAWYHGWGQRRDAALRKAWRYHPYRGWTMDSFAIPGITVGQDGLRVLPGGGKIGNGRDSVFLFGGSAVWGYESRDSATVNVFVVDGLRDRGIEDLTVVPLAQAGYSLTQEVATLTEMLRLGHKPALTVFVDGVNEVGHFVEGEPLRGIYGQLLVERRIELGKRTGFGELLGMGLHLGFVRRIHRALSHREKARVPDLAAVCDTVAQAYRTNVRQVEALAAEFGFTALFIWQPTLATTTKQLSEYEAFRKSWEAEGGNDIGPVLVACASAVDSAMARGATPYLTFDHLFDGDSTTVFLDGYGHLTERANAVLGDSIAGLISPRLSQSRTEFHDH